VKLNKETEDTEECESIKRQKLHDNYNSALQGLCGSISRRVILFTKEAQPQLLCSCQESYASALRLTLNECSQNFLEDLEARFNEPVIPNFDRCAEQDTQDLTLVSLIPELFLTSKDVQQVKKSLQHKNRHILYKRAKSATEAIVYFLSEWHKKEWAQPNPERLVFMALLALVKATAICSFNAKHRNFHMRTCIPHCQRLARWQRGRLQSDPGPFPLLPVLKVQPEASFHTVIVHKLPDIQADDWHTINVPQPVSLLEQ